MKLNIAICDDDQLALDNEADIIHDVLKGEQIEHNISCFKTPQELLQNNEIYNIVFLDVEMDIMNGIETAKRIRERYSECLIFFVTNYDQYLDDALNQHAFRFWTKPIDRRKLVYGIESAIKEFENMMHSITVRVGTSNIKVMVKNIIYLYTEKKKVHFITIRGEIVADNTYKEIDDQLKNFTYVYATSRGEYVNFKYIKNYDKKVIFCTFQDQTYRVYVSRRRYDDFNNKFISWVGGKE